jgi:putative ABC transport system substrate-binding protein
MRRREFLTLAGCAAALPLAARAQQAMPVIGFLHLGSADKSVGVLRSFRDGLAETGFRESQNVAIEYRWADGDYNKLPALASDLVAKKVVVLAAPGSGPAALAAKAATTTIPVVFRVGVDPVEAGIVDSLNRPGANLTGVAMLGVGLAPKRLELMHELIPTASSFGVLINPTNPVVSDITTRETQAAASALGLKLQAAQANTEAEYDLAFAELVKQGVSGLVVGGDGSFTNRAAQLGKLSLQHRLPTIYQFREFVTAGGLISYGGSNLESYRLAGVYTGRILKGEKPGDLPVQQVSKVEMIVNLKSAKALGLNVPLPLLGRADEMIE